MTSEKFSEAQFGLDAEAQIPTVGWQREVDRGLQYGLEAAESIRDRSIPTFSRGELPHFAGINTFLKAPYLENVHDVGNYFAAFLPFTPRITLN